MMFPGELMPDVPFPSSLAEAVEWFPDFAGYTVWKILTIASYVGLLTVVFMIWRKVRSAGNKV